MSVRPVHVDAAIVDDFVSVGGSLRMAAAGKTTLSNGTATIATRHVTADSVILLSRRRSLGTIGHIDVDVINPGVGFVVKSQNILDTSEINWIVIEPLE